MFFIIIGLNICQYLNTEKKLFFFSSSSVNIAKNNYDNFRVEDLQGLSC